MFAPHSFHGLAPRGYMTGAPSGALRGTGATDVHIRGGQGGCLRLVERYNLIMEDSPRATITSTFSTATRMAATSPTSRTWRRARRLARRRKRLWPRWNGPRRRGFRPPVRRANPSPRRATGPRSIRPNRDCAGRVALARPPVYEGRRPKRRGVPGSPGRRRGVPGQRDDRSGEGPRAEDERRP